MPKMWIITTNPLQQRIEEGHTLERRDVRLADWLGEGQALVSQGIM